MDTTTTVTLPRWATLAALELLPDEDQDQPPYPTRWEFAENGDLIGFCAVGRNDWANGYEYSEQVKRALFPKAASYAVERGCDAASKHL